jgi:hypothetical protein
MMILLEYRTNQSNERRASLEGEYKTSNQACHEFQWIHESSCWLSTVNETVMCDKHATPTIQKRAPLIMQSKQSLIVG